MRSMASGECFADVGQEQQHPIYNTELGMVNAPPSALLVVASLASVRNTARCDIGR